jgi:hypothetical protein
MVEGFGMNTEELSLPQANGYVPLIASRFLSRPLASHMPSRSGFSYGPSSLIRASISMMSHSLCTHAVMLTVFNLVSTRRQIFWRLASVQYRDSNFESLYQFRTLGSQSRKFPLVGMLSVPLQNRWLRILYHFSLFFFLSRECTDCTRVECSLISSALSLVDS